jgi:hypothetical protein
MLLQIFLEIISGWTDTFAQERTYKRAVRHAVSAMCSMGRRTLSRSIAFSGRDQLDWSADYRLHSRCEWSRSSLFRPILKRACALIDETYIAVAFDDTKLHKTGKKIKSASWQRDPMSPPFNVNLVWGIRFLQATVLLPLYRNKIESPPRSIPVQFTEVPCVKKPGKKATEADWIQFRKAQKEKNLSTEFVRNLRSIRDELDMQGFYDKKLLAVVDGSFCNRVCMAYDAQRTEIIARTRKDARLTFKSSCTTSRRYYSTDTFTPEQVRQNDTVVWQTIKIYHGGQWREVRFKEVNNVLWRTGTKRRPMRLIVIAPTPYRLTKNKKLYYRNPAYLLTTDLEASVELLTQKYFDRWQIEVNHREEKDTLGVGEAQVRSDKSVPRQPAFVVATYAALLLAGVIGCQDQRQAEFTPLPKWRKFSKRLSCLDLVTQLRREVVDNPKIQGEIGIQATAISTVLQSAA